MTSWSKTWMRSIGKHKKEVSVKNCAKIDDIVVQAKVDAARELAVESDMAYIMYAGSELMKKSVLDPPNFD